MKFNGASVIDFFKKQATNLVFHTLASPPASPVEGQPYYDSVTKITYYWNGTAWKSMDASAGGGNVSQASNSSAANKLKISAGADKTIQDYAGADGLIKTVSGVPSPATAGTDYLTPSGSGASLTGVEKTANKDATGGYVGMTLFKINFKNALNTITSFFTNSNTVARTYTFQDKDGTIADLAGLLYLSQQQVQEL